MAKKRSSKPKADLKSGPSAETPAPTPAPLPVVGAPLPPGIFPDPATLPQFQPPIPLPQAPATPLHDSLVPIGTRSQRRTHSPRLPIISPLQPGGRKHNPTFDAPPAEVAQARALAQNLRAVLGHAMQSLTHAVREIEQMNAYLVAHPEAAREFERLDISTEEALRFHAEALDV